MGKKKRSERLDGIDPQTKPLVKKTHTPAFNKMQSLVNNPQVDVQEDNLKISDAATSAAADVPDEPPILAQENIFRTFLKRYDWEQLLMRLFASYFFALSIISMPVEDKFDAVKYAQDTNVYTLIFATVSFTIGLSLLSLLEKFRKIGGYALIAGALFYAINILWRYDSPYPAIGITLVVVVLLAGLIRGGHLFALGRLTALQCKIIIAVCAILISVYIFVIGILRYKSFSTSCFDFGIFAQMYENMRTTMLPNTTCERGKLLSHFAVHVSPIYYLILPIYAIFPYPQTLFVSFSIVSLSGVIPLYLICRHYKFSNAISLCVSLMYVFSPALIGASLYDIHENMFLPSLIFWFLYFFEKGKSLPMYISMALVWFVKEDAPIFMICIALYMIFTRNRKKQGAIVLFTSIAYMAAVMFLLKSFGEGVMSSRLSNLMTDKDAGLGNVATTVLRNPALFIKESFEEEKILCFLQMMIPVAFLPLFPKKISQLVLVVPLFIENLVSDYPYQYSIKYQYVFGPLAMLIYSSVVIASEMKPSSRKLPLSMAMCSSLLLSVNLFSGHIYYYESYKIDRERLNIAEEILYSLPKDASVEATTYFVPQLWDKKEVYVLSEGESVTWDDPDFLVIKNGVYKEVAESRLNELLEKGYEYYDGLDRLIAVYKNPNYNP